VGLLGINIRCAARNSTWAQPILDYKNRWSHKLTWSRWNRPPTEIKFSSSATIDNHRISKWKNHVELSMVKLSKY
jgi:hypothetical protein